MTLSKWFREFIPDYDIVPRRAANKQIKLSDLEWFPQQIILGIEANIIPQNPSMVHGLDCYSMVSWDRYPDAEPEQALIVKWYNNGFVTRYPLFDSEWEHHYNISIVAQLVEQLPFYNLINRDMFN